MYLFAEHTILLPMRSNTSLRKLLDEFGFTYNEFLKELTKAAAVPGCMGARRMVDLFRQFDDTNAISKCIEILGEEKIVSSVDLLRRFAEKELRAFVDEFAFMLLLSISGAALHSS